MQEWITSNFEHTGQFKIEYPDVVKKKYGEVRASVVAFENDIHNLSVCIHHLSYVISDDKPEPGLKLLYISNIVENFITNVRSIYDHLAVFARIVASHEHLHRRTVSLDSLNELIKQCEIKRPWAIQVFTEPLVEILEHCRQPLKNMEATDFPLLPYLQRITKILFTHMDDLGAILMNEFYNRDNAYRPELTVLGGICMPDFVKFINHSYSK